MDITYEEWKSQVLGVRRLGWRAIDDYEEQQPVLVVMFWRVRIHFRPWRPFYLRVLFWTDERLEDFYESNHQGGWEYPAQVEVLRGEWG